MPKDGISQIETNGMLCTVLMKKIGMQCKLKILEVGNMQQMYMVFQSYPMAMLMTAIVKNMVLVHSFGVLQSEVLFSHIVGPCILGIHGCITTTLKFIKRLSVA